MKKTILTTLLLGSLIFLAPKERLTATSAASDKLPDAGNYLRLEGQYTDPAWISNDLGTVYNQGVRKFNHIVFFNSNPAWNISSIQSINYEVKEDAKTQPTTGQVSNSNFYHMSVKANRKFTGGDTGYTNFFYEKESDAGSFQKTNEVKNVTDTMPLFYYLNHYYFKFPEMGKTQNIKDLFQTAGDARLDLNKYLIHQYKNLRTGFETYNAMIKEFGSNYEYYLILPIETAEKVTVNYLSLTATDINGNIITDDAGIGDGTVDPESGETFYTFPVTKTNGTMRTSTAFYFPGSNRYKLTGVKMTGYKDNNTEKDFDVMFYAGNLIGKNTLKDVVDSVVYIATLENKSTYLNLNYTFNGDNNCILIDFPAEVSDASVTVRFIELNTDQGGVLKPFALNLLDNNGNYGIKGELALDKSPNAFRSLLDYLKNLFNFGGNKTILEIVGQLVTIAFGIVILVLIIKLISFVISVTKVFRRK